MHRGDVEQRGQSFDLVAHVVGGIAHQVGDGREHRRPPARAVRVESGVEREHAHLVGELGERCRCVSILECQSFVGLEPSSQAGELAEARLAHLMGDAQLRVVRPAHGTDAAAEHLRARGHLGGQSTPHELLVARESEQPELFEQQLLRCIHRCGASAVGLDRSLAGEQPSVEVLDHWQQLARRLQPDREHLVAHRERHGEHPVVLSRLGPVLHVRRNRRTGLQSVPQDAEDDPRHVLVAHEVVGHAVPLVG